MKTRFKYYNINPYAVALFYIAFLYCIYLYTGIITNNEAEKYISASLEILSGNVTPVFEHHLFYSSYIFFITPFIYLGGPIGVVIAQAAINFVAAICLGKTIDIINPANKLSSLAVLLFLFSYPLQFWTLTLFSDIFFVCIISIALFYTLKKKSSTEIYLWIFLLLVQTFSRPPGIFLSSIEIVFFLYYRNILPPKHSFLLGIVTTATLTSLLFFVPVETNTYIKPVASGTIIVLEQNYDIPRFNNYQKSSLIDAYSYLIENKGIAGTIKLYFMKWLSFFTLTRPYYSVLNNTILSLYYLLYFFSTVGVWALSRQKSQLLLLISCIFILGNITALTYNEWHYRFTLATFPFLIILSIMGLKFIISKPLFKSSSSFTSMK